MNMVLIVTPFLDGVVAGQVSLLRRYLLHFPDNSCVALTRWGYGLAPTQLPEARSIKKNFGLWFPPLLGTKWGLDNLFWIASFFMTLIYFPGIFFIVKRYQIKKIFLPAHTSLDILMAFFLTRMARVPCVVLHMDDAWESLNGACWAERTIIRCLLPSFIKKAQTLFVLNDFMKVSHEQKYGRSAQVIYPPIDAKTYDEIEPCVIKAPGEFCILYTGSIYSAQWQTMENLAKALAIIGDPKIVCYVCGSNDAFDRRVAEIGAADYFRFSKISLEKSIGAQKKADLLFLGLAFDSNIQPVINSAFPAKLVEYMASGSPMLVCVPKESFVSFYLRQARIGEVIHVNDPKSISESLLSIKESKVDLSEKNKRAQEIVADHHEEKNYRRGCGNHWRHEFVDRSYGLSCVRQFIRNCDGEGLSV